MFPTHIEYIITKHIKEWFNDFEILLFSTSSGWQLY